MTSTKPRKQPTAISRMRQDYMRLKRDPLPYITAEPLPNNILEWHYVVKGPANTPYYGGYYHGTLLFPREFPFKPPSIYMLTPNGRFKTNTRLCLSISGKCFVLGIFIYLFIIIQRFPSWYVESNVVRWHYIDWVTQFYGRFSLYIYLNIHGLLKNVYIFTLHIIAISTYIIML